MAQENVERGSGTSGPPPSCNDLDDKEHWVYRMVCRKPSGMVDIADIAHRIGTTTTAVRSGIDGLVDHGLVQKITDEAGDRWRRVGQYCPHVNSPGQSPFLPSPLTEPTDVDSSGGLGGMSVLARESVGSPAGGPSATIDTPNPEIDYSGSAPTLRGPRGSKKITPMQSAFGLVRYFDRLAAATTMTRWNSTSGFEAGALRKEIYRWLTVDRLDVKYVSAMIREFFADVEAGVERPDKIPLWRAFIAKKTHYHQSAALALLEDDDDDTSDPGTEAVPFKTTLPTGPSFEERHRR